jgi:hypothetical protein
MLACARRPRHTYKRCGCNHAGESNSDDASDMEKEKYDYGLAPHLFAKAFPWHVIVDIAGRILQVGPSMSKIVGICAGMKFNDLFTIIQPANVDTKSVRRVRK